MADSPLLGPNGQPINNPFTSQQGMKSDVSVNVQPALAAFADLQKVLEGLTKTFGVATRDNLKGQENFYRYVGDKENERRAAVERLKRAAIDSINEETKAQLAAYETRARAEKASSETITRGKVDLAIKASRQIENVEREASKKAQGPGFAGRTMEGIQGVAGRIGGPIGGLVSGAANLVAEPEIAIPALIMGAIIEIANKRAAFTKTGAQLAGAGLGGMRGPGAAQLTGAGFDERLFAGFGDKALSADQQRAIIAGMAGSRSMIGQTAGGGMDSLRGNLGLFANILPDASKEMELFTDATKSLGMSQKDISKVFFQTQKSSKDLQITQLDAISAQIEMQTALRNITNDGTVAASVLDSVGSFFHGIGKSEAETRRMTMGVAAAGANLSLSQMAGMLAFTKGIGPTSGAMEQALFGKGGMLGKEGTGVFGLMGEFFSKVGGQAKNPMERMFMAERLNKDFGLGIQTQDLPKFFDLSEKLRKGEIDKDKFGTDVAALSKAGKQLSIDGMDTLIAAVNPITEIQNMFSNFWREADNLFTRYFGKPSGGPMKSPFAEENVIRSAKNIAKQHMS